MQTTVITIMAAQIFAIVKNRAASNIQYKNNSPNAAAPVPKINFPESESNIIPKTAIPIISQVILYPPKKHILIFNVVFN